jgi:hypothetical protein
MLLIQSINLPRRVSRYNVPKGTQNPYIKEEQTSQWSKENKYKRIKNDLQYIHKTKV